jgi:hypothetical protein
MKAFIALLAFASVTLVAQGKALACAGCVDIYPETIKLSRTTSKALATQIELDKKESAKSATLNEIRCSKKSATWSDGSISCLIGTNLEKNKGTVVLKDAPALELLKKLNALKAEITNHSEDGDEELPATGKKISIGEKTMTMEEFSVKLNITAGELTCKNLKAQKTQSCALTIHAISTADLVVELN